MLIDGPRLPLAPLLLALAPPIAAQEARGPFDAATVVLQSGQAPFRRLADFDLDGDIDALAAQLKSTLDEYRLALVFNDAGVFSNHASWTSPTSPGPNPRAPFLIVVGHLNADAHPDVCIVHGVDRQDWLTTVHGPFYRLEKQAPILLPAAATTLALADLDGDGIDDVLWTDASHLRLQTSSGPKSTIAVAGKKHSLSVLPRNGPFRSNLVVAHVNDDVRIFYGHRATGLVAGPVFPTGVPMGMVDTGDVDGDRDVDAVVFGMMSYRILRRHGRQSWTLEPEVMGGPAASLHDVDGDGDLDGVCCSNGGGGNPGHYEESILPSDFLLALNDGGGGFAKAFAIAGVGSPELAGVVDVDLDGDADLVAGRCVYYADGPLHPPKRRTVVPPPCGPRGLSDCDGDGDVDVGFSLDSVYRNDGTGAFTLEPRQVLAPAGASLRGPGYPGDFDGDGDVDLVAEVRPGKALARANGAGMVLLCNDGGGRLSAPIPASSRGVTFCLDDDDPEKSLLVDTDLDGDLDLVTRTATNEFGVAHSRLWANTGTGRFRDGGRANLRALWMGDVDQDGDVDMIGCGAGYEGTSTYLDLASHPGRDRFPRFTWSGVSWHQRIDSGLAVADLDGDGFTEFAAAAETWAQGVFPPHRTDTDLLLLMNRFRTGGMLAPSEGLEDQFDFEPDLVPEPRLALGEILGNSLLDAVAGPLADELVDIVKIHQGRRSSFGAFRFDRSYQVLSPGHLIDLDGDGELDVLGRTITFHRAR